MGEIDLTPFGFPGKTFQYHGRIKESREQGDRLLFIFNEAHKDEPMIRRNLKNACALIDLGIIGFVGVEEYPFRIASWDEEEVLEVSAGMFEKFKHSDGIIDRQYELSRPFLPFGATLKLLRPTVRVETVEDALLHEKWERIGNELDARLAVAIGDLEAQHRIRQEYDDHPLHRQRDAAFIQNTLER